MMTIRAVLRNLVIGTFLLGLSLPVAAHRIGIPVTTIEWNPRSETWEIIHRLDAHDFNPVMQETVLPSRLYATAEGLVAIDNYMQAHFNIIGDTQTQYIGAEQDGDFVWVYYEMRASDQTVLIRDDLLMSEGEASTALVNVKTPNGITSLIYTREDAPRSVDLRRPG